jgi:hypothetical protein
MSISQNNRETDSGCEGSSIDGMARQNSEWTSVRNRGEMEEEKLNRSAKPGLDSGPLEWEAEIHWCKL